MAFGHDLRTIVYSTRGGERDLSPLGPARWINTTRVVCPPTWDGGIGEKRGRFAIWWESRSAVLQIPVRVAYAPAAPPTRRNAACKHVQSGRRRALIGWESTRLHEPTRPSPFLCQLSPPPPLLLLLQKAKKAWRRRRRGRGRRRRWRDAPFKTMTQGWRGNKEGGGGSKEKKKDRKNFNISIFLYFTYIFILLLGLRLTVHFYICYIILLFISLILLLCNLAQEFPSGLIKFYFILSYLTCLFLDHMPCIPVQHSHLVFVLGLQTSINVMKVLCT